MTPALDSDLVPCGCGYCRRFADPSFDTVVERVRRALETEGFGVLTTIDVQATMLRELGRETPAHLILGVCKADLVAQALSIDPTIEFLLPCNVSIRRCEGDVLVSAVSPRAIFSLVENDDLEPVVAELDLRLKRALRSLS